MVSADSGAIGPLSSALRILLLSRACPCLLPKASTLRSDTDISARSAKKGGALSASIVNKLPETSLQHTIATFATFSAAYYLLYTSI